MPDNTSPEEFLGWSHQSPAESASSQGADQSLLTPEVRKQFYKRTSFLNEKDESLQDNLLLGIFREKDEAPYGMKRAYYGHELRDGSREWPFFMTVSLQVDDADVRFPHLFSHPERAWVIKQEWGSQQHGGVPTPTRGVIFEMHPRIDYNQLIIKAKNRDVHFEGERYNDILSPDIRDTLSLNFRRTGDVSRVILGFSAWSYAKDNEFRVPSNDGLHLNAEDIAVLSEEPVIMHPKNILNRKMENMYQKKFRR